jgi:hypothetical protein
VYVFVAKRLCTAEYSVFVVQTCGIGGRKHGPAFISITCYIGCVLVVYYVYGVHTVTERGVFFLSKSGALWRRRAA